MFSAGLDRLLKRPLTAVALILGVLGLFRSDYLFDESPRVDEEIQLAAARRLAAGESPYSLDYYNYPPPLLLTIHFAERAGRGQELMLGWRAANLCAIAVLAWFSAAFSGWSSRGRFVAALAVALSPLHAMAIEFGNISPLVSVLALLALAAEFRRPWLSTIALGASLALKPTALAGAAFLSGHRLTTGPRSALAGPSLFWPVVVAVLLAPGASLLPEMFERMSRPYFNRHQLSFERAFAGLGWEVPATWIAATVLLIALALARRRPLSPDSMVMVAPVVALAALPVVWAHTFALTLPLQMKAIGRAGRRWSEGRRTSGTRGLALQVELLLVSLAVGAIHGAAWAVLVNDWPDPLQIVVCLIPVCSPALLLLYLQRTEPADPSPAT